MKGERGEAHWHAYTVSCRADGEQRGAAGNAEIPAQLGDALEGGSGEGGRQEGGATRELSWLTLLYGRN